MAKSDQNLNAVFQDTANAIRAKKQSTNKITPRDFADEVASIQTGITPTGTLQIQSNGFNDVTNYAWVNVNVPPRCATQTNYDNLVSLDVGIPSIKGLNRPLTIQTNNTGYYIWEAFIEDASNCDTPAQIYTKSMEPYFYEDAENHKLIRIASDLIVGYNQHSENNDSGYYIFGHNSVVTSEEMLSYLQNRFPGGIDYYSCNGILVGHTIFGDFGDEGPIVTVSVSSDVS